MKNAGILYICPLRILGIVAEGVEGLINTDEVLDVPAEATEFVRLYALLHAPDNSGDVLGMKLASNDAKSDSPVSKHMVEPHEPCCSPSPLLEDDVELLLLLFGCRLLVHNGECTSTSR